MALLFLRRVAALLFCASLLLTSWGSRPTAAAEPSTATGGWWWLHDASPAAIQERLDEGFRLVDLDLNSSDPLRFSAAFIRNSGSNATGWWWYYHATPSFISEKLDQHNARLIDIERYTIDGTTRYAVIMVANSGAQATGWWWYYNATPSFISEKLDEKNAHLIDIEAYNLNGARRYAVIMVANSGAQAASWWWYYNVNWDFVTQKLSEKQARLIDIERHADGRYTVIMQRNQGTRWWWARNQSLSQLSEIVANFGARIVDSERYTVDGNVRYDAVMVSNLNPLSAEVGALIRANTNAERIGFALKQVDGPVLAGLRANDAFYSASTMKVVHHLHALRWASLDPATRLATQMTIYSNSCSESGTITNEPLSTSLGLMMNNSDNARTNAIQNFFGENALNATMDLVGMSDQSAINAGFGGPCGGPSQSPPNQLTPNDINLLYERVGRGELLTPAMRQTFHDLMPNEQSDFFIAETIDEEAAAIGLAPELLADFKDQVEMMHKHGSWGGDDGPFWGVRAGYVGLPIRVGANTITRGYVYSVFVENTTFYADGFTPGTAVRELLRPQIRQALISWQPAATLRVGFEHTFNEANGALQLTLPAAALSTTVKLGVVNLGEAVPTANLISETLIFRAFAIDLLDETGAPVSELNAPGQLGITIDTALLARYGRPPESLQLVRLDREADRWIAAEDFALDLGNGRANGEFLQPGTYALISLPATPPATAPNDGQTDPDLSPPVGSESETLIFLPMIIGR